MRKQECFDYSRRALLSASGALALLAALRPLRTFVQASDGKLRIGIIGSGHIGGAIGGLWVKAGHPVLFSSRHLEELTWWRGSVHSLRMVRCHRRSPSAMHSFSPFRMARCRNSVEITAARFKVRSYSTPAMPYQRATELSPMRWSAKVLVS